MNRFIDILDKKLYGLLTQESFWMVVGTLACIGFGFVVSIQGEVIAVAPAGIGLGLVFVYAVFQVPQVSIYAMLIMAFLIAVLSRYYPVAPWGLTIDIFLILSWAGLFFKKFKSLNLKPANNLLVWIWMAWFFWVVVQIANPMAASKVAWFYAMRGIALYSALFIPLVMLVFNRQRDMEAFFRVVWFFSIIGVIWAMKQMFIGVSWTEQRWLDAGAYKTHVLFGNLRAFSYYSEAAQFGASMAHVGLMALVYVYGSKKWGSRIIYLFLALFFFYGMLLSGSRGPVAVPAIGGIVFLFFSRNYRLLTVGVIVGALVFGFLKFTTIGQSNYQISRLRTAVNPSEDKSFQVRKEKEARLAVYLANKPLGGGVGSAGFWGQRFTPGTFLAETPTDGHYSRIWMEMGIIGLALYGFLLFVMLAALSYKVWIIKDPSLRILMAGMVGSIFGMLVASYTNGLFVQMPTGILMYASMAFIWMAPRWDEEISEKQRLSETKIKLG